MTKSMTMLLAAAVLGISMLGLAHADEESVRKGFTAKFPKAHVQSVTKIPNIDLYEVIIGTDVYYTDDNVQYLVEGSLTDLKTEKNLTAERQRELKETPIAWKDLPLDLAIKKVKGKGERKVAVFSDPDCPFCKRLENTLKDVDNVTIYTFLFPLADLHPQAVDRSRAIWCSPDRIKAWDDYMLNGMQPGKHKDCDSPVEKVLAYGQKKNINSTPTLVFASGKRVNGAYPRDAIEQNLNGK
ncbi:MAG: DsbC family protein [Betaproteobacteria bacterium]|nr:DsbC family protein [Betaproteobacteria bacterium]